MLLANRRDAVKEELVPNKEKWGWIIWRKAMLSRKLIDFLSGKSKNRLLNLLFKKTWGHFKQMPKVAPKSFAQQWRDLNGKEE